jgi:hypothetical protein
MILTAENVLDYLLERQLITPAAVVDGDYRVDPQVSRHTTFRIRRRDAPGLFLKQPQRWDGETLATVQREAMCYELATAAPAPLAPLAPLLPPFHGFDPEHQILALGLVGNGESLHAFHQRGGPQALHPWIGATLGELLGRYHHAFRRLDGAWIHDPPLPDAPPWILNAPRMAFAGTAAGRRAAPQVLELIARDPQLATSLETLRHRWRRDTLLHGDLKLQNCLLAGNGGGSGEDGIKIVDWELACLGEASWDVGSLLQSYLALWVLSMPAESEDGSLTVAVQAEAAELPLAALQPLLQALWHGYARWTEEDGTLVRCLEATGARLLQTAFEYGAAHREVHPNVVLLIQLASNILAQPHQAAEELLGVSP